MNSHRFWNKVAAKYYSTPIKDEESYQKKLEMTRQLFRKDMDIYEFGCGTGGTAVLHAPYVHHVYASDVSENMISYALDRIEDTKVDNVTFRVSSVEDADLSADSLDMVLALSLLHLLEDKSYALEKMFKALKPGGYLVSSTACLGPKLNIFKLLGPIGRFFGLLPYIGVFSEDELVVAMEQVGFEIETRWKPDDDALAVFLIARKPA